MKNWMKKNESNISQNFNDWNVLEKWNKTKGEYNSSQLSVMYSDCIK